MGKPFRCSGRRPWLGSQDTGEDCAEVPNLQVVLKGASNVYYPLVQSGLFIPITQGDHEAVLDAFWNEKQDAIRDWAGRDANRIQLGIWLEAQHEANPKFRGTGIALIRLVGFVEGKLAGVGGLQGEGQDTPSDRERFRYREFEVFKSMHAAHHSDLSMRALPDYDWESHLVPANLVEQVVLLDKLRETRVLTGFQRLTPDVVTDRTQLRSLLWGPNVGNWLPAIIVRGEGIFIRFNDLVLNDWEQKEQIAGHFKHFMSRLPVVNRPVLTPRFLFLHTLAHMLLRRLTFECGYGSSALRERIYCSQVNQEEAMNAIVIYTASGDSEGSLGGLVGQGEPGRLESMIRQSLEDAQWCSSDPVCSEIGLISGQGPNSVNGAACHSCALVPETSCEFFNKYLDRSFVIDIDGNVPSSFVKNG